MTRAVKIIKDEKSPEPDEIIAKAVLDISRAMTALKEGPLRWGTVVLLVSAHTKISKRDVQSVLDSTASLATYYLKPKKP